MKKKILSLLTAFAMVFGILVAPFTTASASNGNTPNGKAKPDSVTSTINENNLVDIKDKYDKEETFSTKLYIHKLVSKSFGDKFPFLHDGGKISLQDLTTANNGEKVEGLDGVEFTYYKVDKPELLDKMLKNPKLYETKEQMEALVGRQDSGITKTTNNTVTTKTITQAEANADTNNLTEGESGVATLTLEKGYYWFIETNRPPSVTGVIAKSVPFGIAIPVLNQKQDKWLKAVHTYPKNVEQDTKTDKHYDPTTKDGKVDSKILKAWVEEYDKAKKAYDQAGETEKAAKLQELERIKNQHGVDFANYLNAKTAVDARKGSTVPYEIQTELIKGQKYKILTWTDAMTKGLTYDKGSLELYIKKPGSNKFDKVETTDYTKTERNNGFDLVINKEDYIASLNKMLNPDEENSGNVIFKLVYSATVNGETVVDKIEENNITFIPGENKPGEPTPSAEGKIQVDKNWVKENGDADTTKKTVTVRYILEDQDGNTVAEVTLDGTKAEVNAIEGVKFDLDSTNKYKGTFSGLDKDKQYKLREFVNGYEASFKNAGEAKGAPLVITNKPNKTVKTPEPPKVVTHDSKFVKLDGQKKTRLAGAEFVVTRKIKEAVGDGKPTEKTQYLAKADDAELANRVTTYTNAEKKYQDAIAAVNKALENGAISATNKATVDGQSYDTEAAAWAKVTEFQTARDNAYKAMKITWKWIPEDTSKEDKIPDGAFVFTSNKDGQIYVEGLADGDYSLKEKKAPEGYAKRNKDFDFTVGEKDGKKAYDIEFKKEGTNTKDAWIVENKKITIPQTGGIGSLIFIVSGLAIMTGAFIAYKRSQAVEA